MGIVFCGFERENSFAVSPKVLSVDVSLVSKGFPTANVLRQFSGEESTKIDDLKTSEHGLERFHFFWGEIKPIQHQQKVMIPPGEKAPFRTRKLSGNKSGIFCLFGAVTESLSHCGQPTLGQIFLVILTIPCSKDLLGFFFLLSAWRSTKEKLHECVDFHHFQYYCSALFIP